MDGYHSLILKVIDGGPTRVKSDRHASGMSQRDERPTGMSGREMHHGRLPLANFKSN